ncbi:hypothetical protein QZH41_008863 [Actinostola sp. cb2023]|nr:hypothetical protein QZH41_008863 [Actinostola sp. cb2023]
MVNIKNPTLAVSRVAEGDIDGPCSQGHYPKSPDGPYGAQKPTPRRAATKQQTNQTTRASPSEGRKEAEQHVQQMIKDGIIQPSSSAWASPIVLVKKKDGSTRFCVDYRKLNEATIKDSYPLPVADSSFDALSGSQWFSMLDLSSGYWQVAMATEDRENTAFTTGSGGLYQFTVMPFGLVNAPATFERLMDRVLAGLPWDVCLAYLDDIIVHADNFETTKDRLRQVFRRMRDAGLKLSSKKCHLFQQSVTFLGHVVSDAGLYGLRKDSSGGGVGGSGWSYRSTQLPWVVLVLPKVHQGVASQR